MPNTSPSSNASGASAALRAEAALWKQEADAIRAAITSIPENAGEGRETYDGTDADDDAQAAVNVAIQRAQAQLALAEAAYAARIAEADAWDNHTHPYIDNT